MIELLHRGFIVCLFYVNSMYIFFSLLYYVYRSVWKGCGMYVRHRIPEKRFTPCTFLAHVIRVDRLKYSSDIYKIISAEIPPILMCCDSERKVQADKLHATVIRCMIHGPCGNINCRSPCMVDGKCTKYFSKAFSRETVWDDTTNYPNYKRRSPSDGGETGIVGDLQVDNQWVVPYSPYLLLKVEAHINVEACISRNSAKNIFMYINKVKDY